MEEKLEDKIYEVASSKEVEEIIEKKFDFDGEREGTLLEDIRFNEELSKQNLIEDLKDSFNSLEDLNKLIEDKEQFKDFVENSLDKFIETEFKEDMSLHVKQADLSDPIEISQADHALRTGQVSEEAIDKLVENLSNAEENKHTEGLIETLTEKFPENESVKEFVDEREKIKEIESDFASLNQKEETLIKTDEFETNSLENKAGMKM